MSHVHVVLGGSGGAGAAIVTTLARDGHQVRAVSRRPTVVPDGVSHVVADISDPVAAKAAVHGADVVHMAAHPGYTRWAEAFPALLETVIRATASAGAKLVMVDNLYAYGAVEGPMTETTPLGATDVKGRVRAALAERLAVAHRDGEVRVTIGRASDFFGPGVTSSALGELVFTPLAKPSARLRWIGRDDVARSVAYVPDVARALVTLALDERADGRVWHLPHGPAITGRTFLDLVNAALPEPRPTGRISPLMVRVGGLFSPTVRETAGILHQWDRPFVVDDRAFRETFDVVDTSVEEAVATTVAAFGGAS